MLDPYKLISQKLWVPQPTTLQTDNGHGLLLTPCKFIPYRFSFGIKHKGQETDILQSIVCITDEHGVVWEGESIWDVQDFIDQMTAFSSITWPVPFEKASTEWKAAFEKKLFFRGARGLLDDRFTHRLFLDDRLFLVPFHYQGPVLDLAFVSDDPDYFATILARVSGMYAAQPEESNDLVMLPQIVFQVKVQDRLFINYYYEEAPGCWGTQTIPRSLVFRRTTQIDNPNPLVSS